MQRLESASGWLLLVLIALLPFEFTSTFAGLSILQLTFVAAVIVSIPVVRREWRQLVTDRLVLAGFALVFVFWLSAVLADENQGNAVRGAIRVTSGWMLLCIASRVLQRGRLERVWCWAAVAAAGYGLVDYMGFGLRSFFRTAEFYNGDLMRLSGSFEYPNTAGTFFAMSLPIVWSRSRLACIPLWLALLLTYSRGAFIGTLAVLVIGFFFQRDKGWMQLAAMGMALMLVVYGAQAARQVMVAHAAEGIGAQYELKFNQLRAAPGTAGTMPVTLRNTGSTTWQDVVLSYHWYDPLQKRIVFVPERVTSLPAVVEPGQTVTVQAEFRIPSEKGLYLLDWDLKNGDRWFSIESGVVVGIVEATIAPGASFQLERGDVSRWYRLGPGRALDASVDRAQLWSAAWMLIQKHPVLGGGPDSFRLLYGTPLGYTRWDRNIRANSLYLELLTGCGLLGLLAFAGTMAAMRWNMQPAALAIGIFLVHGVVDSFLMTTPIYFAFWLLVGTVHASRV
jgi:hypothetical protein